MLPSRGYLRDWNEDQLVWTSFSSTIYEIKYLGRNTEVQLEEEEAEKEDEKV